MAEMTRMELIEGDNGWVLPIAGTVISQCRVDYAFTLILDGEDGSFEIRIEQPFTLAAADGDAQLSVDPAAGAAAMAPAITVVHHVIDSAVAFNLGDLTVTLADRRTLRVSRSDQYEAWQLVGPLGLRVVSAPGGELSIWHPRATEL